ncbi:6-phosphogluconolactonase [Williamsia limnetica]|jgi:6-phosphogluconolactonase|uniref:6-phosphogluconolactonase n=1 Tax=Williamsia limnetica TaxID=882452 RepID=A0A318S2T9_WILLI|nr:6-phosphogluconolactonase [Williamsia limnetica]PYE21010.1 6-phosphogluconolactonase [Williamsia limnetica]
MSTPEIFRSADKDSLVEAVTERFITTITAAQAARGTASVVLTGGSNGIALLEALAKDSGDIDWSAVDIYWGDERFVAADDSERNAGQAQAALLDHVPVNADRVFVMASSDGEFGDDIHAAAADYAERLAARAGEGETVPQFDLHLLGMGGEGHINSLFPHSEATGESRASVVAVTNSPKPPPKRITLTLPAIARSREVWFLVSGAEKAEAVAAGVAGADFMDWPCAGAHGTESTVWFVDPAAASNLP